MNNKKRAGNRFRLSFIVERMINLMKTFKFVPAVYKGEKNENGKKEQWSRESADDRHREFDVDKLLGDVLIDEPREIRADTHRRKIDAHN